MLSVRKYDMFETTLERAGKAGEPEAVFASGAQTIRVRGFALNSDTGVVRFMPTAEGAWHYTLSWDGDTFEGDFLCVPAADGVHGPVRVEGHHFRYDDGARYIPVGTTCYAWIHQTPELIRQTLDTLKTAPFNKLRMCVFPKSMPYNQNDPDFYPFERNADGAWDVARPDQRYWAHLDDCIKALMDLRIEADIILFHPYDRWGFSQMPQADNLAYLDYAIRRLSAFRNVWWALSNEYEFSFAKKLADWDQYGEMLAERDAYHHLISAHNWVVPYPKRDWLTHVSYQGADPREAFRIREEYGLPTIIDECGYEGDIEFGWGNLSGFEFMNRVWTATAFGCFGAHGETFHRDDEVLWWAKGGKLYGEAPARFWFLRTFMESLPGAIEPACTDAVRDPNGNATSEWQKQFFQMIWAMESDKGRKQIQKEMTQPIGRHPDFRLIYLERSAQSFITLRLPENGSYKAEIIDMWGMTRRLAVSGVSGEVRVGLPGREGTAVLVTRLSGEAL